MQWHNRSQARTIPLAHIYGHSHSGLYIDNATKVGVVLMAQTFPLREMIQPC
jgi:hypothetical protein